MKRGAAEWVRRYTGTSIRQVALKLGLNPSSFDRRVKNGLTADLIIDIAQAFDRDPVAALRIAGMISGTTEETITDILDQAGQLIGRARDMTTPKPHLVTDDDIAEELNTTPQAAQDATPPLEEPDAP